MPKGTIKLISDRGFGFIRTAKGKDLFFHRKELEGVDYDSLREGGETALVVQRQSGLGFHRSIKMLGEILLKMVSALTPDDIRQMKAAGCGDEVRAILGDLDKVAVSWHDGAYGVMSLVNVQIWANVRSSLGNLRAALRGD